MADIGNKLAFGSAGGFCALLLAIQFQRAQADFLLKIHVRCQNALLVTVPLERNRRKAGRGGDGFNVIINRTVGCTVINGEGAQHFPLAVLDGL